MTDLKSCPFCGGEAKLYSIGTGSPHYGNYHQVVCQGCLNASGAYWSGEQSAIDAWNTRVERTCEDASVDKTTQFYCSKCDCTVEVPLLWGIVNYCPNCGARVVGGDA